MFKKGTKLYSIFTGSCPKCHQESMYKDTNPYKIGMLFSMYDNCSHCHTKYKIEPSFFYGAMYVSYGLGVTIGVATFIISYVIFDSSLVTAFIGIIVALFITFPVMIRLSRNIWINIFVNYNSNWEKDSTKNKNISK